MFLGSKVKYELLHHIRRRSKYSIVEAAGQRGIFMHAECSHIPHILSYENRILQYKYQRRHTYIQYAVSTFNLPAVLLKFPHKPYDTSLYESTSMNNHYADFGQNHHTVSELNHHAVSDQNHLAVSD